MEYTIKHNQLILIPDTPLSCAVGTTPWLDSHNVLAQPCHGSTALTLWKSQYQYCVKKNMYCDWYKYWYFF